MTKNLLHTIMIKEVETPEQIDAKELVNTIQQGYLVGRDPEHKQKKTFGPSTIAYGHGECPRYWYLAFEGAVFEDNSDAYAVANMTNGTISHSRIEAAFKNSGISINSEFKLFHDDPPIFGFGDVIFNWLGKSILGEIKTVRDEVFAFRKQSMQPADYHMAQLILYMKLMNMKNGAIIYENKN